MIEGNKSNKIVTTVSSAKKITIHIASYNRSYYVYVAEELTVKRYFNRLPRVYFIDTVRIIDRGVDSNGWTVRLRTGLE